MARGRRSASGCCANGKTGIGRTETRRRRSRQGSRHGAWAHRADQTVQNFFIESRRIERPRCRGCIRAMNRHGGWHGRRHSRSGVRGRRAGDLCGRGPDTRQRRPSGCRYRLPRQRRKELVGEPREQRGIRQTCWWRQTATTRPARRSRQRVEISRSARQISYRHDTCRPRRLPTRRAHRPSGRLASSRATRGRTRSPDR